MSCPTCQALREELAEAERTRDRSKAVDCRVLLRRHPRHDDTPVEGEGSGLRALEEPPDGAVRPRR
ncbi:hypothetical protein Srufu_046540 [Streptomyces libani subsp. rufus]|nr:hypothetical protein Srufu_046540 [Streptomyces libani subsp. rufus]